MNKSTFNRLKVVSRIAALVMTVVALTSQGLAQPPPPTPTMFSGIIDDFTPMLDQNGPWQLSGQWSLTLHGHSGSGDFSWGGKHGPRRKRCPDAAYPPGDDQ